MLINDRYSLAYEAIEETALSAIGQSDQRNSVFTYLILQVSLPWFLYLISDSQLGVLLADHILNLLRRVQNQLRILSPSGELIFLHEEEGPVPEEEGRGGDRSEHNSI